ncbi:hypothetical protein B0H10DRAFT_1874467 [Mycena sp. CBHHK59/15]|nr:hypothetical protein B0H10DRAFT_1874467 [Mycena sp. CBHHK59/15]
MWVLSAQFDGETIDEPTPQKAKLLKTGTSYPLGRRDRALCINVKKVSRDHAEFTVGKYTLDDVVDPNTRPKLEFTNKKDKSILIKRTEERHPVNPGSTYELQDGDIVAIVAHVPIEVRWQPVCCYLQATRDEPAVSLALCASLGINIVHTPSPNITHHITSTYAATTLNALSLVSASTLVKPEWLHEILRLGNLPRNSDPSHGLSLEQVFALPPISKYRPTFNPALAPAQKAFKVWDPNEERLTMFNAYRFLCVCEGKREIDGELRELLSRAGGKVEVFDVADGTSKWRKALTRGKAKVTQKLVLVADQEACTAAVGKGAWKELVDEAKIFGVHFITSEDILQAVLNTDTSDFDSSDMAADRAHSSSPLPDFIPNTHPEESSLAPEPEPEKSTPPPRRLVRRSTSRQASQEPTPAAVAEVPAPPRRLTRRAQPTGIPIITGIDDAPNLVNNLPDSSMPPPAKPIDPTKPRSSRLKRRVGVSAPIDPVESLISNSFTSGIELETGEEPPLKKFKALFEASDPKRSGAESFVKESGAFSEDELVSMASVGSQTQSQTQTQSGSKRSTRSGASGLAVLRAVQEEEEETQTPLGGSGPNDAPGKKRKDRSFDGDDVEMAGVEDVLNNASGSSSEKGPAAKKRAVQGNAVERAALKPPSSVAAPSNVVKTLAPVKVAAKKGAGAGAATGKPDTDSVFLKAIASTKRGKKTEDDFDRDFNKLKISKPDLAADEAEHRPEWELLETFGDENNLRGNFMVIQDLDVFKSEHGGGPKKRATGTDARWEGKPDFKKFKKVRLPNTCLSDSNPVQQKNVARKTVIELIISQENDSGMGAGYWKGAESPRNDDDFGFTQKRQKQAEKTESKTSRAKSKNQTIILDDSEEDVVKVAPKGKSKSSKPPSKTEVPKKRTTRGASKVPDTPVALFFDDDEEIIQGDGLDYGATLDEHDFGAGQTLQSSAETAAPARRSSRMPTKRKAAPIIVDEDSDDGAVFKGFGKKR